MRYPTLIFLAPFLAGLVIGLSPKSRIGRRVSPVGWVALAAAFGTSVCVLYSVVTQGPQRLHLSLFPPPWDGFLQFGFYFDRLSAVMMVLITGIGVLIYRFSIRYMQADPGYTRFLALLCLTTFTLLCMIASANLLMLFIFWQLLSWLLPLLFHNDAHPPTVRGAFRIFVIQRAGDIAFLAGIVLAYRLYGTLDFQALFIRAVEVQASFSLWPGAEIGGATAVTLLIFIGAMARSAQIPLHMWLPDSLYAPTPVSALLHAGIVNAGGFLLNRLAPLYAQSPTTLHWVFVIGLLTTLLGSSMMLIQNNIKKTLVYSTIGQMGYMIMECGLGAFALAIFHLIAHGIFKGTLFLQSGHVIHDARKEPKHPPQGGPAAAAEFSRLAWGTGLIATLLLPLLILLAGHGVLNIPLQDAHGTVILLFFAWVTASQVILSLYRLHGVSSWKVAGAMMATIVVVVFTYLWAAESFTHFLYPTPGEAAAYFKAAALPDGLFVVTVVAITAAVILGWAFIYAQSHGRSFPIPAWVSGVQTRLYLLFMNRLYADAVILMVGRGMTRVIRRLNTGRIFPFIAGLIILTPALLWLAVAWRSAGIGASEAFWWGVRILALSGALHGSLKALTASRMGPLLTHTARAFFYILGWYFAVLGASAGSEPFARGAERPAVIYACAVTLVIGGLSLAWGRLRARYGDLALSQIGGLAKPMPRFALLFALLVMAAVGLPPFGLFSGFMVMLLSIPFSWDMVVILFVWFMASWYLFRLMQRLLFGPHRVDFPHEDLRPSEMAPLLIVLLLLLALGIAPYRLFATDAPRDPTAENARNTIQI
jgi:NADH-quinone oxidoreductase subunit L